MITEILGMYFNHMAYCNSAALEAVWFNWLVATATPLLDGYRDRGLLYTKVLGTITPEGSKKTYQNPCSEKRSHCIAVTPTPIYFSSYNNQPNKPLALLPAPTSYLIIDQRLAAKLLDKSYQLEQPPTTTWATICAESWRICKGISTKFNLPTDGARDDLANEALTQLLSKIKSKRLFYTPGRAPVFNLLTTTIYRLMYSILSSENKNKKKLVRTTEILRGFQASHGGQYQTSHLRRFKNLAWSLMVPLGSIPTARLTVWPTVPCLTRVTWQLLPPRQSLGSRIPSYSHQPSASERESNPPGPIDIRFFVKQKYERRSYHQLLFYSQVAWPAIISTAA